MVLTVFPTFKFQITINGETRLLQPITKKQKDIFGWFAIDEMAILDFVVNQV